MKRWLLSAALVATTFVLSGCTANEILFFEQVTAPTRDVLDYDQLNRLRWCESTDNYQAVSWTGAVPRRLPVRSSARGTTSRRAIFRGSSASTRPSPSHTGKTRWRGRCSANAAANHGRCAVAASEAPSHGSAAPYSRSLLRECEVCVHSSRRLINSDGVRDDPCENRSMEFTAMPDLAAEHPSLTAQRAAVSSHREDVHLRRPLGLHRVHTGAGCRSGGRGAHVLPPRDAFRRGAAAACASPSGWVTARCSSVSRPARAWHSARISSRSSARSAASVRVGIATGTALLFEGDDYIGEPVNLAARLCAAANPGEVLAACARADLPYWIKVAGTHSIELKGIGTVTDVLRLQPSVQ